MARANDEVEALLYEYTDLLAILSTDPFKPRAFEKAARSVGGYHQDIANLDLKGLLQIPAVGRSIAEKILEYLQTGHIAELDEMRSQIPAGVREIMAVPGLGPKKAMLLYEQRGIASVDDLKAAIDGGRLAGLKGFGAKTEENILRGIATRQTAGGRMQLGAAWNLAEQVISELSDLPQVSRITYAGSLRRMAETIGDVDVLVTSTDATPIMDRFVASDLVDQVLAHGETKSSIVTGDGHQVDLRVVAPEVWGAALIYFTGSKGHNVRIREIAVRKGFKLSEYGLFVAKTGNLIAAEREERVYEELGLPWIPPAMREDRGEIEAALDGTLPTVIEPKQIKGDLHTHTNLTDGLASLEEMLDTAAQLRYGYYAITDHAPNLAMQRMTDAKIKAQQRKVRGLQDRYPKMALLHGSELNIDPDGEVDWPEEFLASFDLTVASVHSHFNQTREEMTRRFIRAMENPFVNIIGHPTTRRIGQREPVDVDLDAIFEAAARTGTALEINAHPDRLDLKDEHVLWARRHGARFAIDTDAHSVPDLDTMRFGVGTAQRGWLTKEDVINAWPWAKLQRFLRKGRKA
ncbi:MAG: DNA polymerase/3'-5' exonuclease PolX [Actinomycetota bacterium]